ncbi:hypothetical protein A2U01_0035068, partial [Trifolium medium]|nr:hypothetical protein [Trifolium medium]
KRQHRAQPRPDPVPVAEPVVEPVPMAEPEPVVEPQPGTPAPAASGDEDGEELGEEDFQEEEQAAEEAVAGKKRKKGKSKELEGPCWTECVFPAEDPAEFPGGPKDKSVFSSYGGHMARYVYEGYHHVALDPVSHGRKMKFLDLEVPDEEWFRV